MLSQSPNCMSPTAPVLLFPMPQDVPWAIRASCSGCVPPASCAPPSPPGLLAGKAAQGAGKPWALCKHCSAILVCYQHYSEPKSKICTHGVGAHYFFHKCLLLSTLRGRMKFLRRPVVAGRCFHDVRQSQSALPLGLHLLPFLSTLQGSSSCIHYKEISKLSWIPSTTAINKINSSELQIQFISWQHGRYNFPQRKQK